MQEQIYNNIKRCANLFIHFLYKRLYIYTKAFNQHISACRQRHDAQHKEKNLGHNTHIRKKINHPQKQ